MRIWILVALAAGYAFAKVDAWRWLVQFRERQPLPDSSCIFNGYGMISPFTFIWTIAVIAGTLLFLNYVERNELNKA